MKRIFTALVLLTCMFPLLCSAQPAEVLRWHMTYFGPHSSVQAANPIRDSLLAYYGMEESSGTRYDGHGSYHLTAYNNPGDTVGVIGRAARFDNTLGQYLQNSSAELGSMGGSFTVSWWQKRYAPLGAANVTAINRGTATNSTTNTEFAAFGGYNSFVFRLVSGGLLRPITHSNANSTAWQHLMMVLDRSKDSLIVYLNGAYMNKVYTPGAFNTISPFSIGANGTGGEQFYGVIDEVYVWRGYTVTPGFASWYYNSGSGQGYTTVKSYTE